MNDGATSGVLDDGALAATLVERAAALALVHFERGVVGETKSNPTDFVTAADREAEALVVSLLRAHRPDDGVLGEEGAERAGTSGRTWAIDPVDGTYNFVRGIQWWCSAVALSDASGVLLGAVHDAVSGNRWAGGPGMGAWRNGQPLPPLADRSLARSCTATYVHPPYHGTAVGEAWSRVGQRVGTFRMLGSGTLDAMSVAEGKVDLVLQHSVSDWDRLPGEALIRAVGGEARRVNAAGVEWYVAGAPTAVAEACDLLRD